MQLSGSIQLLDISRVSSACNSSAPLCFALPCMALLCLLTYLTRHKKKNASKKNKTSFLDLEFYDLWKIQLNMAKHSLPPSPALPPIHFTGSRRRALTLQLKVALSTILHH